MSLFQFSKNKKKSSPKHKKNSSSKNKKNTSSRSYRNSSSSDFYPDTRSKNKDLRENWFEDDPYFDSGLDLESDNPFEYLGKRTTKAQNREDPNTVPKGMMLEKYSNAVNRKYCSRCGAKLVPDKSYCVKCLWAVNRNYSDVSTEDSIFSEKKDLRNARIKPEEKIWPEANQRFDGAPDPESDSSYAYVGKSTAKVQNGESSTPVAKGIILDEYSNTGNTTGTKIFCSRCGAELVLDESIRVKYLLAVNRIHNNHLVTIEDPAVIEAEDVSEEDTTFSENEDISGEESTLSENEDVSGEESTLSENEDASGENSKFSGNEDVRADVRDGYIKLRERNWFEANNYFDRALDLESDNPYAYLGKAMAKVKISRLDEVEGEKLDKIKQTRYYCRAKKHAAGELKERIDSWEA